MKARLRRFLENQQFSSYRDSMFPCDHTVLNYSLWKDLEKALNVLEVKRWLNWAYSVIKYGVIVEQPAEKEHALIVDCQHWTIGYHQ